MSKSLFGALVSKLGFWRGIFVYINLGPELKPGYLEELGHSQSAVMSHYKEMGWVLSPDDEEGLHMFFSPTRVPSGLTREMVRVAILLYPLRKRQIELHRQLHGELTVLMRPMSVTLPLELMPNRRMTERRFRRGVIKFLIAITEAEVRLQKRTASDTRTCPVEELRFTS